MSNCYPCADAYTCTRPVPECSAALELGALSPIVANVHIFIQKANGALYVQAAATNPSTGVVTLDLTDPSKDFFSAHDGLYKIWVTAANGSMNDKLTLTQNAVASTLYGVSFQKTYNVSFSTITIEPIV